MAKDVLGGLLAAAKQFYDHMVSESNHVAMPSEGLDDIPALEDANQHVPAPQYVRRRSEGKWNNHAPNSGKMQPFIACTVILTFLVLVVISTTTQNFWGALACIGALAYALRKVVNYYF